MYKIELTECFKEELNLAYDYIEYISDSKTIADKIISKTFKKIYLIKDKPFAWSFVKDDYLASIGYRSVLVDNYLLFYLIDEKIKTIFIERFLYAYSDYINIIKDDLID